MDQKIREKKEKRIMLNAKYKQLSKKVKKNCEEKRETGISSLQVQTPP